MDVLVGFIVNVGTIAIVVALFVGLVSTVLNAFK